MEHLLRQRYQLRDGEDFDFTPRGLRPVNAKPWNMSTTDLAKLDPAGVAALVSIAISMIPPEWPKSVKLLVKKIIDTMDLRRNLAAQQIYREQIYEKINTPKSAGKRPNAACVLAIVCATRANDQLVKQLKGALAEFDMDFLLDFTRVAFKYDGLFVYDANKGDEALHMIPMDLFNLGSTETGNVSIFHENCRLENSNNNNGEGRLSDVGGHSEDSPPPTGPDQSTTRENDATTPRKRGGAHLKKLSKVLGELSNMERRIAKLRKRLGKVYESERTRSAC
ncbi:hypothetical protein QBC37DRAFT_478744 [Rhypophila decipiens]|uniref:Uncharacterized protein n=1 Tax=Rhypophila decipiens TaxID=261697 RepID=A0AAN7BC86_9PEZI|nr:hypothetical protein QBC37DRAFT_478744 [Rhypophila decipiens]